EIKVNYLWREDPNCPEESRVMRDINKSRVVGENKEMSHCGTNVDSRGMSA
ncbi:hypothetical protein RUM43_004481, partial [Polyplax serrata]